MSKAVLIMDIPKTCAVCILNPDNQGCVAGGALMLYPAMDDKPRRAIDYPLIPAIGYIEAKGNMISWEDEE